MPCQHNGCTGSEGTSTLQGACQALEEEGLKKRRKEGLLEARRLPVPLHSGWERRGLPTMWVEEVAMKVAEGVAKKREDEGASRWVL